DAGDTDLKTALNSNSKTIVTAYVEPSLANAAAEDRFQFERHGYYVADRYAHGLGRLVFNRITTLKDGWGK
ncbi:MAG: glutamine--tRNA ligase, partial [Burkholderiaceae bacterium]|nr:glutamine--tRNA ligase [Burkholderiaceae bacterium]